MYAELLREMGKAYNPARIRGRGRGRCDSAREPVLILAPALCADGEFGAMMQVSLCNDVRWLCGDGLRLADERHRPQQGPVTITYDTKARASSSPATPAVSGRATPTPGEVPPVGPPTDEDPKDKARRKREAKQEATKAFLARQAEREAGAPVQTSVS